MIVTKPCGYCKKPVTREGYRANAKEFFCSDEHRNGARRMQYGRWRMGIHKNGQEPDRRARATAKKAANDRARQAGIIDPLSSDRYHRKRASPKEAPMRVSKSPHLGAMVYYVRYGSPGGEHKPEPSPAVVTQVKDPATGLCQLFVMNPNGTYHNETPYSAEPKPGHWTWPEDYHGNP